MNVALIFGGRSPEHEVSIVTAHQVNAALAETHDVIPIYVTKDGAWLTGDKLKELNTFTEGNLPSTADYDTVSIEFGTHANFSVLPKRGGLFSKKKELPIDVVFPAIHGVHGEDGSLQGLLELIDIPYVGAGVVGSGIGMDKIIMKAVLNENGLPILPYVQFTKHDWDSVSNDILNIIDEKITYPIYVKPAVSGSSIGVSQANDEDELRDAIELACRYCRRIVVEQGIENGYEINCSVMGTHMPTPSVCEQPIASTDFLSFDDKYIHQNSETESASDVSSGMAGAQRKIPAPIPEKLTLHIQKLATEAFHVLDCAGIARVDFLVSSEDQVYVNEINTIPGSFSFYLWEPVGISFTELVSQLVELAVETHQEKNRLIYSYSTNLLSQAGASFAKLKTDSQPEKTA
jgi:D-alanine-D-alanine ligase